MNKYTIAKSLLVAGVSLAFAGTALAAFGPPPPPPPPTLPTSTDQCKKGGWQDFNGLFKNQGDCVSFVVTNGRNAPDGPNAP